MADQCKCGSSRLITVQAHCSDCFNAHQQDTETEHQGYVPEGLGIGRGDDVEMTYCLDCGQIQDWEKQPGLAPKEVV